MQASNVNVAAAIATCASCGAVFSIGQASSSTATTSAVIPDAFTPAATAERASASYRGSARSAEGSQWSYRWFRWMYVFMVLFLVFWDTISFSFVVVGLRAGGPGLLSLLLPHAWIGVAMSYWTLAHLFNRSTIELGPAGLRVTSGPIPWRSTSRALPEIAGFDFVRGFGNRGHAQFKVRVIGHDKRAKLVLGGLNEEEASYLARELDAALRSATKRP